MTKHIIETGDVWDNIRKIIDYNNSSLCTLAEDLCINKNALISIANQTIECKSLEFQYNLYKIIETHLRKGIGVEYPKNFKFDESVLISERTKYYMNKYNITKCNLHRLTNISKSRLTDILSSKKDFTVFEKYGIARVLGVSIEDLTKVYIKKYNSAIEDVKYDIVFGCYIRDMSIEELANKLQWNIINLQVFYETYEIGYPIFDCEIRSGLKKHLGVIV